MSKKGKYYTGLDCHLNLDLFCFGEISSLLLLPLLLTWQLLRKKARENSNGPMAKQFSTDVKSKS
jgi:hypothetical protein